MFLQYIHELLFHVSWHSVIVLRFVSQKSQDKQKVKSAISEGDKKESNESVYDDDEGQLEEQEEEAGEITRATNQVF